MWVSWGWISRQRNKIDDQVQIGILHWFWGELPKKPTSGQNIQREGLLELISETTKVNIG